MVLTCVWAAALLWAGAAAATPASESAPALSPASAPVQAASDAAERAALLQKLGAVKAQLAELQDSVRTLEKLTQEPGSAAAASEPSPPKTEPFWSLQLQWLSVVAIIAVMLGVSYSRRPERSKPATAAVSPQVVAAELQTRLGGLDLSLDAPAAKDSGGSGIGPSGRQPDRQP